jgi:hypothetical protein
MVRYSSVLFSCGCGNWEGDNGKVGCLLFDNFRRWSLAKALAMGSTAWSVDSEELLSATGWKGLSSTSTALTRPLHKRTTTTGIFMGTSITPALIAKRTWSEIGAQRFSGICQSPRKLSIKSATPISLGIKKPAWQKPKRVYKLVIPSLAEFL